MGRKKVIPTELAAQAERGTWFSQENAQRVLDWLESEALPLWGMETAKKLPDGNWTLLLDPMLVTSLGIKNTIESPAFCAQSICEGRDFVSSYPDLMFEPTWPGY